MYYANAEADFFRKARLRAEARSREVSNYSGLLHAGVVSAG